MWLSRTGITLPGNRHAQRTHGGPYKGIGCVDEMQEHNKDQQNKLISFHAPKLLPKSPGL
jgi:hypothetical protein